MLNEVVVLEQEAAGVQIPGGNAITLPEGSRIYITQMLGNSITAATDIGLVRISRDEADRLGITPKEEEPSTLPPDASLEDRIWDTLKAIYDPEIPVDIVNLGLVYGVEVITHENGKSHVHILMTLTAPGCGMGPHLMAEAETRALALDGVETVDVEFVWDPPWNQEMMTEEAKMTLGLI